MDDCTHSILMRSTTGYPDFKPLDVWVCDDCGEELEVPSAAFVARSSYIGPDGLTIVLEVPEPPMGFASGYIPPPSISFFRQGAQVDFVYSGEEPTDSEGEGE